MMTPGGDNIGMLSNQFQRLQTDFGNTCVQEKGSINSLTDGTASMSQHGGSTTTFAQQVRDESFATLAPSGGQDDEDAPSISFADEGVSITGSTVGTDILS